MRRFPRPGCTMTDGEDAVLYSSALKVLSMGKRTSASYLRALSLAIKRPLKDSFRFTTRNCWTLLDNRVAFSWITSSVLFADLASTTKSHQSSAMSSTAVGPALVGLLGKGHGTIHVIGCAGKPGPGLRSGEHKSASESPSLGSGDINGSQAAARPRTQLANQSRGDGPDTGAVSKIVLEASALHHEGPSTTCQKDHVFAEQCCCKPAAQSDVPGHTASRRF